MKERPIPMSAPMVLAILAGRKTQTRRLTKVLLPGDKNYIHAESSQEWRTKRAAQCPYGNASDGLWVREAWAAGKCADGLKPSELDPGTWKRDNGGLWYLSDGTEPKAPISPKGRYRNARFMPRWASRIALEITGVRVERLQDISEEDARAEGAMFFDGRPVNHHGWRHDYADVFPTARHSFAHLWDQINGKKAPWSSNPWLWVIEFKRIKP